MHVLTIQAHFWVSKLMAVCQMTEHHLTGHACDMISVRHRYMRMCVHAHKLVLRIGQGKRVPDLSWSELVQSYSQFQELYNEVEDGQEERDLIHVLVQIIRPGEELCRIPRGVRINLQILIFVL